MLVGRSGEAGVGDGSPGREAVSQATDIEVLLRCVEGVAAGVGCFWRAVRAVFGGLDGRVYLDLLERHGELTFGVDRYSEAVRAELLAMSSASIAHPQTVSDCLARFPFRDAIINMITNQTDCFRLDLGCVFLRHDVDLPKIESVHHIRGSSLKSDDQRPQWLPTVHYLNLNFGSHRLRRCADRVEQRLVRFLTGHYRQ